jgi:hypothetical protein
MGAVSGRGVHIIDHVIAHQWLRRCVLGQGLLGI